MSSICIITALPAESRVFIDALKLKPILDHGWRLYGNSEHLLLQTGLGKLKACAATSALLHHRGDISAIVNAGIAGGLAPVGTTLLGHQIVDQGSGYNGYPHLPPQRVVQAIPTTIVETLEKPSSDYRAGVVFDMEASGIMSAAATYLSSGSMQFVKVISDNSETPLEQFKPSTVTPLVELALPTVLQLLEWFAQDSHAVQHQHDIKTYAEQVASCVHHTVNDSHQLLRLLQQYRTLAGELPEYSSLSHFENATALKQHLHRAIASMPLDYGKTS